MFQVVVVLENRNEYVPFFSQWAACVKAADYAKCVDVERVFVTDAETGEIMAEFAQNSVFLLLAPATFARPGNSVNRQFQQIFVQIIVQNNE